MSQAAGGGVKGTLLKVVDPLFRRDGAGAVLPIRIRSGRSPAVCQGASLGTASTTRTGLLVALE